MRGHKLLLSALPIVTVVVVAFALVVVGAPRAYQGARLYGGPTEGVARLAWRLALIERFEQMESPAPPQGVVVQVTAPDGRTKSWSGQTDAQGMASVTIDWERPAARGELDVRVTGAGRQRPLAEGRVELPFSEWVAAARESGDWLRGGKPGLWSLRVAAGRGAFAVPFADPLWIELRGPAGPVPGARIEIEPDGFDLEGERVRTTDALGRVVVQATPREHFVSARVVAAIAGGEPVEWSGALPVVPGALHARVERGKLRLRSPIEREIAYFALLGPQARIAGGPVALTPDPLGGSTALIELPELPPGPVWAVVGAEPELDSASTVGWPIAGHDRSADAPPAPARAVPDRLLLDGMVQGFRADTERRRHARWLAIAFATLAMLLAGVLVVLQARRAEAQLDQHLRNFGTERRGSDKLAEGRAGALGLLAALLFLAMGVVVLALVALFRMG